MILRINGGAGSNSRTKVYQHFLQMLVDRINASLGFGTAEINSDQHGYYIAIPDPVSRDELRAFLERHGALNIENSSDAMYVTYDFESSTIKHQRKAQRAKPQDTRTSMIVFYGEQLPLRILRYTASLLEQGLTVVGFMFEGTYRMPVFIGSTDPALWKAVKEQNEQMQPNDTGFPSRFDQVRIYSLHRPLTLDALERAIEMASSGLPIVGFYAHDDVVEPLTAGVMGQGEYDRLLGNDGR